MAAERYWLAAQDYARLCAEVRQKGTAWNRAVASWREQVEIGEARLYVMDAPYEVWAETVSGRYRLAPGPQKTMCYVCSLEALAAYEHVREVATEEE